MNTLVIEGHKNNIRVNALAPTAATRMTEDLMPKEVLDMLVPEAVTAGALTLVHEDSPNRLILAAGAGGYSSTRLFETEGVFLPPEDQTPEGVQAAYGKINDTSKQDEYTAGSKQGEKFLTKAMAYLKNKG
jgi:NAD(P)-dependent dehydrogenase (short-subunit alcohol dehydrogenase family)